MIKIPKSFAIVLTLVLSFPLGVFAQNKKGSKRPKRTTINFEDQLIKGQNQRPDLLYLMQRKRFNYKRLIRLREDFLPEMEETATEIKEGRVNVRRSSK